MKTLRRSADRGHADHGWLDARHTFSFAGYLDPDFMGFRDLRVINEDRVDPGAGFPRHGHRDMEIVTVVLAGALEHKDSLGNGEVMRPGDVQRMSAGSGVLHSEFNPSRSEPVHLLQIWIQPAQSGGEASYEQKPWHDDELRDRLTPIATPDGRDGSLRIGQDVTILRSKLTAGTSVTHELAPNRHAWIQVTGGSIEVGGERLDAGDGVAISDETQVTLQGVEDADVILFDLR